MMSTILVKTYVTVLIHRFKISVHSVDYKDERRYFSVQSESYVIYFCLFPSIVEVTNATTYTHHNGSYYFVVDHIWN
jgi:hypothetical protein